MKCPDCNGSGIMKGDSSVMPFFKITLPCSTCEGSGHLPDEQALNHCPACGEPIPIGAAWCDYHRKAEDWA